LFTLNSKTVDREFTKSVEEISGEPLTKCMQCGTCSGLCPVEATGDVSPRQIIHLTALGQRDKVMNAKFAWMCASCYACQLRCPRGLDIPKIIEAIRLITLRKNENFIEPFAIETGSNEDIPQIAFVSAFRKHTA